MANRFFISSGTNGLVPLGSIQGWLNEITYIDNHDNGLTVGDSDNEP